MRRVRQFSLACLALVLWLWGTQHCTLEAAGILDGVGLTAPCQSDESGHCAGDGCDTLENGAYRTAEASICVPAPEAVGPDCCLCLALLAPRAEDTVCFATAEPVVSDLSWVPVWHFARRMAPPSRAPSLRLA
ncbi:MAG: hypothetical protein HZA32_08220 [Opitutae bacterium]|nr:hypothetical protein [Opitutae bacterium]